MSSKPSSLISYSLNDVITFIESGWGLKLGQRVAAIRSTGRYVEGDDERRKVLDDMGFLWRLRAPSPDKNMDVSFDQIYDALKTYKKVEGNLNVPSNFIVPNYDPWPEPTRGMPLGKKIPGIRSKAFLKANPQASVKLEKLGFECDGKVAANDARFNTVYLALVRYKELNGDLLVPQPFIVPEGDNDWDEELWGLRLGARVNAIRSQGTFVKSNESRKQLLDDLGFEWKLKSDIIDFLIHQYNDTDTDKETRSPIDMIENDTVNVKQKKKNSRSMPPLDSPPDHVNESKTSTNNPLSPKDMIFQKVYNRYPPLKDLQLAIDGHDDVDEDALSIHMHPNFYKSFTGLGDNDIRQKYHPIMQGLTSSDLDIVTVGTASCVPGVTRGVSCTALRLQWRRRGEDVQSNKDPVTGGIWIFDCGESTQVSLYIRRSIIMIIFGNEETLMLAPDRELRLHGDAHLAPVQRRSGLNQHG